MKISIIVSNSLKKDPRVIKQIKCAMKAGHTVQFIGFRDQHYDVHFLDNLGCEYKIVDLGEAYVGKLDSIYKKTRRKILNFIEPIKYIKAFRPDVIHANDFDMLPCAYVAKKICNARIVYDAHEVFAENAGIAEHKQVKTAIIAAEQFLVKRIDRMVCVSHAAAEYYQKKYKINLPTVITNCPMKSELPLKPKNNAKFEVLYHGLMIDGRGYEEFVLSGKDLDSHIQLILRGYGRIEQKLKDLRVAHGLEGQVTFAEPVEVAELIQAASTSMVGVVLTKPLNINFELSVSNKVFEYAHAGLPVIMSNVREHVLLNNLYQFGIILDEVTPEHIKHAILDLYHDKDTYQKLADNAVKMSQQMNWENESKKLLQIYTELHCNHKKA